MDYINKKNELKKKKKQHLSKNELTIQIGTLEKILKKCFACNNWNLKIYSTLKNLEITLEN